MITLTDNEILSVYNNARFQENLSRWDKLEDAFNDFIANGIKGERLGAWINFFIKEGVAFDSIMMNLRTIRIGMFDDADYLPSNLNLKEYDNIETIQSGAFTDCKSLEKLTLPENAKLDLISKSNPVVSNCPKLIRLELSEDIKEIDSSIVNNCPSLKQIVIPDNVKEVGLYPDLNVSEDVIYYFRDNDTILSVNSSMPEDESERWEEEHVQ